MTGSRHKPTIATSVTAEEKLQLEEEARREGVTLSVLIYRRVMNKPDAQKRAGRPPRIPRDQPDQLISVAEMPNHGRLRQTG